jgi:hypothetical protein
MLPGVVNVTPFPVHVVAQLDAAANQYYVIVMSAAFVAKPGMPLGIEEEQPPLNDTDVYFGKPGESSIRYDADFAMVKRRMDVVVNGSAFAPGERTATRVEVTVRIGHVFEKHLLVTGDRDYKLGPAGLAAQPFTSMPIVYERASGGSHGGKVHLENPVGIGFNGAASADPTVRSRVPNVEFPDGAATRVAGFSVISRAWRPRLPLAGTYDDKWKAEQFPLIPTNFDPLFYQCAPVDQQIDRSVEGEVLVVRNMTPDGTWTCKLPRLTVPLSLRYWDGSVDAPLRTDTLIIEPDEYRVTFKARTSVRVRRNGAPLDEVVVGRVPDAWWLSRMKRKRFVGSLSNRFPLFEA